MPIYEYQCRECRHQLEKLQKLSDPPLVDCPQCGRPQLQKLISAAGFRLKGGGWYETDFKNDRKRNLAGDDGGASADSSGDSGKETKKTDGDGTGSGPDKSGPGGKASDAAGRAA